MNTSAENSPERRARIAFVAVLLLLAAAGAVWWLAERGRMSFYEIHSHDSVSGLIAGAPVEFHGVEVGKVDEVELVDPRSVRVVLAVKKGAPVTTATVATITGRGLATRGFTGYVYVNLEESAAGGRPLVVQPGQRWPAIAAAPSRAVSLDTSINQLNDSVQVAVALLRTTLDAQTIASLKSSVAHLDEVTRTLAANNARMQAIVVNAQRTTAQMPPLLQAGTQTLGQMNSVIASTQDTVQTIRTQLLPETQRMVTRLDELSTSLADTADRVRRNPAVLVRGTRARPGPGEAP
jgi:phospholipid/cholesterol/gamma-HCH transport system substrate-binding protein